MKFLAIKISTKQSEAQIKDVNNHDDSTLTLNSPFFFRSQVLTYTTKHDRLKHMQIYTY